jgi:hypothetical protein
MGLAAVATTADAQAVIEAEQRPTTRNAQDVKREMRMILRFTFYVSHRDWIENRAVSF